MTGNGTESDPYRVGDFADLKAVGTDSATYGLDKVYELIADIDAAAPGSGGPEFSPIGYPNAFCGVLHGRSHSIKNFQIDTYEPAGLFSNLSGSVDSLGLIKEIVSGKSNVGGIAGNLKSGRIAWCYATGQVKSSSASSGEMEDYVGGLVGYQDSGIILGCSTTGPVTAGYIFESTTYYAGGLVGYVKNGTVNGCHATGMVSGMMQVGGLVGCSDNGIVINCYSTGAVEGMADVGGLIGNNKGTLQNCYATGSASGGGSIGGFAGYNYMRIAFCYATGNCQASGGKNEDNSVGGFVGTNEGSFRGAKISFCYAAGAVQGNLNVGGFVGINGGKSDTVNSCYSDTTVSGKGIAAGANSGVLAADSGFSTAQMKKTSTFSAWNLDTVWTMRVDSTYPGLRKMDNAPFAFADSLAVKSLSCSLTVLLSNDCDIETGRSNLTLRVASVTGGTTDSTKTFTFPQGAKKGTAARLLYRVGEIRPLSGDTLWGNAALALIELDSTIVAGVNPDNKSSPPPASLLFKTSASSIFFFLPSAEIVTLKLFDVRGRALASPVKDKLLSAGPHTVRTAAGIAQKGAYVARLQAGSSLIYSIF